MQDFQVKLELDGTTAIVNLQGDLTHAAEDRLNNIYDKIVSARAQNILFDFSRIDYINSAGMSIIITLLTRAQQAEQHLAAFGLSDHFQKIFDMVGLLKYIPHHASREEALAALN